jgi:hypothetical protein
MKYLMLVMVLALSTGCSTQAQKQAKMDEQIVDAKVWCGKMGINYFNTAFQQCYMTRYENEVARHNENRRIMGAALGQGLKDYGDAMNKRQQQYRN